MKATVSLYADELVHCWAYTRANKIIMKSVCLYSRLNIRSEIVFFQS